MKVEWQEEMPQCESCGKAGDDVTYGPDPYADEIHGDDTPVWLCEDCRRERLRDV